MAWGQVREIMVELCGDEALVVLLDHSHREIVYTACGVLINFAADKDVQVSGRPVGSGPARPLRPLGLIRPHRPTCARTVRL